LSKEGQVMTTLQEEASENKTPLVIVAGGLDPSGGAGLAVDIGAVHASGAIALPIATCLTAQSAATAYAVYPVDPEIVGLQLEALFKDSRPSIIKTGLIQSSAMAKLLVEFTRQHNLKLIADPVIKSTSGLLMAGEGAPEFMSNILVPAAYLVTPNAKEAEILTGLKVNDAAGAKSAAKKLVESGAANALVTGGHINSDGDISADYLYNGFDFVEFKAKRESGGETRGTGCMLASAIAGRLAGGEDLEEAITESKTFVSERIVKAANIAGTRVATFGGA